MADNIKIVGEILNTQQVSRYDEADLNLFLPQILKKDFGQQNDYIEYFIKDLGGSVLSSNYYATQYQLDNSIVDPITGTTTQLYLDPETDAKTAGYNRGVVNVKYNFFAKQLISAPDPTQNFWIKEISTPRTEIKVARQDLSNTQLSNAFNEFNAASEPDTMTFFQFGILYI